MPGQHLPVSDGGGRLAVPKTGDEIACRGRANPARDQRELRRPGRGAAERRAHRLLIIQQAQEILAALADDHAAALLYRVGVEAVELAGDLALQVAGEGRDPHRALISFGPEARRRDIAQGLADAGAGLGEHRLRLVRALPRRKSSRDGGGVIGLLRPRLGVLAEQGGEPAARLIRADRIVAGGWRRGALLPFVEPFPGA